MPYLVDYSIGVLVYGLVVNNYGIVKTLEGIGSVYKRHLVTKLNTAFTEQQENGNITNDRIHGLHVRT